MPDASAKVPVDTARPPLRLGYLPLTDAAPLVVAEQRGLFTRHGLRVQLRREIGWATIREKLIFDELDAAQAPAPMLWSTTAGLDCPPCNVVTGLVLSSGGHGLALSRDSWDAGVRDADGLAPYWRDRHRPLPLTMGVSSVYSAAHVALLVWLRAVGLNLGREVRIVVVPPAQMVRYLAAGIVDGYCANEPWSTLATRAGAGWCPAWNPVPAIGLAGKVLLTTARFAEERLAEHRALIAALAEACDWCDEPENREALAEMLADSRYLNISSQDIAPGLANPFAGEDRARGRASCPIRFSCGGVNIPSVDKALALQTALLNSGIIPVSAGKAETPRRLFREELYREAVATLPVDSNHRSIS